MLSREIVRRAIEFDTPPRLPFWQREVDFAPDDVWDIWEMDRAEAAAIAAELGDVPVTAPKSSFGHLGAAGGAVELVASILGLEAGLVPPTLNYETPDPLCPVNVVHGEPLAGRPGTALAVNICSTGQSAAVVIAKP